MFYYGIEQAFINKWINNGVSDKICIGLNNIYM